MLQCNCIKRVFSSQHKQMMKPFSRRRGSMFYIKTISSTPPPSLISIYRKYLKLSLTFYKSANQHIGQYLFKLLQSKKHHLKKQYQRIQQINQLLQQIKTIHSPLQQHKNQPQTKYYNQKQQQHNHKHSPLFTRLKQQKNPQKIQSYQVRVSLQKQSRQRTLTQFILSQFERFYHLSNILQKALNLQIQTDTKILAEQKIIRLAFNASQYFTPCFSIRQSYHSLELLNRLNDDMEYQVLSQRDKQFVRDVIAKVCGRKKLNHSRYIEVVHYLKDPNAIINQHQRNKIQISKNNKPKTNKMLNKKTQTLTQQSQQINDNQCEGQKVEENFQQQQQNDNTSDQWSILKQKQRNQAVKNILLAHTQQQSTKAIKIKTSLIKKSLLFQILSQLKSSQQLIQPNQKLQNQIYQITRRLFKIVDQNNMGEKQNNNQLKYPLLEEFILDNQFLDQFIKKKCVIIV